LSIFADQKRVKQVSGDGKHCYWFFQNGFSKTNLCVYDNLALQVPELDIPIYFLHGIYDYTCSYQLANDYFQSVKAPLKGFYTFEKSAHSPMFEEPEKFQKILREDVLAGSNKLAD